MGATSSGNAFMASIASLRRAYRSQLLVIAAHDLAPAVEPSLPTTALPAVCQALSTLADITLQCALVMAKGIGIRIPEQHANLARWFTTVTARPSARAWATAAGLQRCQSMPSGLSLRGLASELSGTGERQRNWPSTA